MSESVGLDPTQCATVSLAQAAKILGVHRSTAWELWKRGDFPLPVLQIGSRLRVPKAHLERLLANGS
ncbi:MAG: helix-turn-helix domain-containing protein [Microthrixaceae bacterium]